MLVNIGDEYFINPQNFTYAKLTKGRVGATLTIYLVGEEKIVLAIDPERAASVAEEILDRLK